MGCLILTAVQGAMCKCGQDHLENPQKLEKTLNKIYFLNVFF